MDTLQMLYIKTGPINFVDADEYFSPRDPSNYEGFIEVE